MSMEESNSDGKRKTTPSLPANYISILQLQERWNKEKERKRKEEEEEEERRRKQLAEDQQRIEEDLKRAYAKGKQENLDEKPLNRNNRKDWDRNRKKKESIDGEESAAIRSERGEEEAAPRDEGLPEQSRGRRKRYDSKKKKKKDAAAAAAVKGNVVDECESIAPPELVATEDNRPVKGAIQVKRKKGKKATGKKTVTDDATAIDTKLENLSIKRGGETENLKAQTGLSNRNQQNQRHDLHQNVVECGTENHTPVKDGIRVYRKKGENATGKKSVEYREKAVTDDEKAIETLCASLSIERGESKNLKAQTGPRYRNNRPNLPPRNVRMPIRDATMVWVKKGQNERAGDGTGSGM
ncbi:unnamed protein product [Microthlaspi erraticum]|uniref:Uncharacterized protein n=1 Tax=Microthlaspi erraticum TaxID=1685480 RepID=A0A6D2J304_9BRAS|nr:unnamed protein product [Microthlaspi erraticum]